MAEYIEREALLAKAVYMYGFGKNKYVPLRAIESAPAADVVEVVRCLNCKHSRERNEYERRYLVEGVLICTSHDVTDDCWSVVWPNHYCSCGERRESDASD